MSNNATESQTKSPNAEKLRMVIVYRADLPEMTRAKGEIEAGHGFARLIFNLMKENPELVEAYMADNQPKLNMEVPDLGALRKIQEKATARGVPNFLVEDAGYTVFNGPTITCLVMGPMNKTNGNALTRDAKMRL
jgi:peptidyl-tRNA hydrolase